jgi:hypothetical protein
MIIDCHPQSNRMAKENASGSNTTGVPLNRKPVMPHERSICLLNVPTTDDRRKTL